MSTHITWLHPRTEIPISLTWHATFCRRGCVLSVSVTNAHQLYGPAVGRPFSANCWGDKWRPDLRYARGHRPAEHQNAVAHTPPYTRSPVLTHQLEVRTSGTPIGCGDPCGTSRPHIALGSAWPPPGLWIGLGLRMMGLAHRRGPGGPLPLPLGA